MAGRRMLLGSALGLAGTVLLQRAGSAQSSGQQGQAGGGLRSRGAPAGRAGAATRGAEGELTLDLVAPLRGVGLTSVDQPKLCYIVSGRVARPARFTISTPGQARPLVDFSLPRAPSLGLVVVRLRDHGVRLPSELLCVWSVTLTTDPQAPSRDLVGSALLQYRPNKAVLGALGQDASPDRGVAALAQAGYWYDAIALAEQEQARDGGRALAALLAQADLPVPAGASAARF